MIELGDFATTDGGYPFAQLRGSAVREAGYTATYNRGEPISQVNGHFSVVVSAEMGAELLALQRDHRIHTQGTTRRCKSRADCYCRQE